MKKNITYIIILALMMISGSAISQNAKEILTKLNATYGGNSYQMNYSVSTLKGENNEQVSNYSGVIAKEEGKLYLNTTEELTIVNDKYHVYVNKLEKVIFVNEVPEKKDLQAMDVIGNLDSLLNSKSIKLIATDDKFTFFHQRLNREIIHNATVSVQLTFNLNRTEYRGKRCRSQQCANEFST